MCLADEGVEKWIAAPLSSKCTYSLTPPQPCVRQQLRHAAVFNIGGDVCVFVGGGGNSDFSLGNTQL